MRARNWLLLCLSLIATGGTLVVGLNVAVDPYGIYHDTRGSRRLIYGDDRVAKYLQSERYVPDNFNAILVGSSMSANWNMSGVEKLRIYNESLMGINIVEEKAIAEQAIVRPEISVALLVVHPFLTLTHGFATVKLEPAIWLSSLGSENLVEVYKDMGKIHFHLSNPTVDYAGTTSFVSPPTLNPTLQRLFRPGATFDVDPVALAAYRGLVAEIRAHHIQMVFIVPPVFEDLFEAKQAAFGNYAKLIAESMKPEDLLIDFTSEEFGWFRKSRSNFADGVHLAGSAPKVVVSTINARINDWIAQGRLRPPLLPRTGLTGQGSEPHRGRCSACCRIAKGMAWSGGEAPAEIPGTEKLPSCGNRSALYGRRDPGSLVHVPAPRGVDNAFDGLIAGRPG